MGAFHTICTLLSILGKRFQDVGRRVICIESGVIAEGSVSVILSLMDQGTTAQLNFIS